MKFRLWAGKTAFLWFAAATLPLLAQDFPARHQHARGYCEGIVKIGPDRISYSVAAPETVPDIRDKYPGKLHNFDWKFEDIRQVEVSPTTLRILTYEDRKWPGEPEPEAAFTGDFERAYLRLMDRMNLRLVTRFADPRVQPLWTLPVKQLGRKRGTQGELLVGSDRIVYNSAAKDASRTWRYQDIEEINSAGPFQLTIATSEVSKLRRKGAEFKFQLGEAIRPERYESLHRRLRSSRPGTPLESGGLKP